MKSVTLSFEATVLTTATDPYDFVDDDGKRVMGDRRKVWLLIEPGEAPLECRVADDLTDWHGVVEAQGGRISATVKLRGFAIGNRAELRGDLIAAGPASVEEPSGNGRRREPLKAG